MWCENKQVPGTSAALSSVSIKVPTVWQPHFEAWFLPLDAQFVLTNVTMDATKFNHTLSGPHRESAVLIADVLNECCYARLKGQLSTRLSVSEMVKLNHLLIDLMLGDRPPKRPRAFRYEKRSNSLYKSWIL